VLVDCRELPSGSTIETDVCVVGAGPAALSLARALDGTRIRVSLFERGGEPGAPRGVTEPGAAVDVSDFEPPPVPVGRFGGAANEWIVRLPWNRRGVRMVPLSPVDLESRPWVVDSGWPITWDELDRYYRRAHEQMSLGPYGYGPGTWADERNPPLPLERFGLTTAMERFPRSSIFTTEAFDAMRVSSNITVHLHGSIGSLEGEPGRVTHGEVDAGTRARLRVDARVFVVAGGGLDNPRLLLASRSGAGYGCQHDNTGRYFMDHLRTISGSITPNDGRLFDRCGLYDIRLVGGALVMGKLTPTDEHLRHHELLNSGAMLLPKPPTEVQQAIADTRAAVSGLRARRVPAWRPSLRAAATATRYLVPTAARMAVRQRRFPPSTDAGWSNLGGSAERFAAFAVEHQIEQVPNRENLVRLGGRSDEFGRQGLEIVWRWSAADTASLRRTQELFVDACERSGIGRFEPVVWDEYPALTTPGGSFHPTGATRMHTDPRRGVVDADGRVHGVANLFVAGSSVFPTGGYANPTFTVVALAVRLADRLRAELTSTTVVSS
jgi:choline dehydrogenase-like flavoprotein